MADTNIENRFMQMDARLIELEKGLALNDKSLAQAHHQMNGHERECAVRYKALEATMTELKGVTQEVREMVSQGRGGIKALLVIGSLIALVLTLMKIGQVL